MKTIIMGLALASMTTSVSAAPLWQNIDAGMTVEQVHALYPVQKGKRPDGKKLQVEHHAANTELHGFLEIGKCLPRVEIIHPKGVVTGVYIWMRPEGVFKAMCAEEARNAVLTKFGRPITRDKEEDTLFDTIESDEETLTWVADGMTVKFFHESVYDAWHIEYETTSSKDASGL